jgi:transmembrane sensor
MADGKPSGILTGVEKSASNDVTREAATAWLVRVQSDAATADDWNALTAWLEAKPANADAFATVEAVSVEIDASAEAILAALGPRSAEILPFSRRSRAAPAGRRPMQPGVARRPAWRRGAIAAAVVGLAAAVGFASLKASEGPLQTYSTRPGETRSITLADGSRIRLDAASTMSVRLGLFSRRVQLGDAEATFDVAKDARRPFEIAVGDQRVRVIGTEFNIRNYDGLTDIAVRRGIVAVYHDGQAGEPLARLTKGVELTHVVGSDRFATRQVDPDAAFAWTQGRLICDDLPLSQIVGYLNRRYATPIRLAPGLGERRFSGVLELGDERDLIRRLAAYLSLTMHGSNGEISLS